jgi:hypothetical protein
MEELDIQLANLQKKLQLLLKQNQILSKEIAHLKRENDALQTTLESKNSLLEKLQQQVDAFKINTLNLDDSEKQQLHKRIDEYLKDIEKCLTLLHT